MTGTFPHLDLSFSDVTVWCWSLSVNLLRPMLELRQHFRRSDRWAKWRTSGRVGEKRLPSADTIEGRELSTAWPIIWSNGGPSVQKQKPRVASHHLLGWLAPVRPTWTEPIKSSIRQAALAARRQASVGNSHTDTHSPICCHWCLFLFMNLFAFCLSLSSFMPPSFWVDMPRTLKAISSSLCCHALSTHVLLLSLKCSH